MCTSCTIHLLTFIVDFADEILVVTHCVDSVINFETFNFRCIMIYSDWLLQPFYRVFGANTSWF